MSAETQQEIQRQAVHFIGIFAVLGTYALSYNWMVVALLISIFISATLMLFNPIFKNVPGVKRITNFLQSVARKSEVEKGYFYGAVSFFIGLLLVLVIFQSMQALRVAALVLIFGDSVSTVAGKAVGKIKLVFNPDKTLEGSLAGLAAAFLILLTQVSIPLATLFAAVGMFVEALPIKLNDNITIPLAVGAAYWLIIIL